VPDGAAFGKHSAERCSRIPPGVGKCNLLRSRVHLVRRRLRGLGEHRLNEIKLLGQFRHVDGVAAGRLIVDGRKRVLPYAKEVSSFLPVSRVDEKAEPEQYTDFLPDGARLESRELSSHLWNRTGLLEGTQEQCN